MPERLDVLVNCVFGGQQNNKAHPTYPSSANRMRTIDPFSGHTPQGHNMLMTDPNPTLSDSLIR